MAYQETLVQRDQHRIYVRDHPGAELAIILMHGFPDQRCGASTGSGSSCQSPAPAACVRTPAARFCHRAHLV
jgi:hypothetical protein